jgi:predicted amidohydrolase
MKTVRVAAAQTAAYREDVAAALECAVQVAARASAEGAELLCFPECFLQGYLTDDAVARSYALDLESTRFQTVLGNFAKSEPMIVMGIIEIENERLYNTAIVFHRGILRGRYRKIHLLKREKIFESGTDCPLFEVSGLRFGINICYDTNFPKAGCRVADLGARIIVCPANNMLPRDTAENLRDRHNAVRGERCRETGLWLISSDVTGERDDCVSWGPTAILNPAGVVARQLPLGQTGLLFFDVPCGSDPQ